MTKIKKEWLASHIVSEYIDLYSIKNQDGFLTSLEEYIKRSQLSREEWERYKTFVSRSVSDKQKADLLFNNPIFDYIPLDRDARRNVYPLKELWKYWWRVDETDWKIYDVVSDAADFWSWFLYQGWKIEYREVKMPKFNRKTKSLDFKKQIIEQYYWIYSEYIRIEDIFFDWLSVEDSNIAIWRKFWNKDDYINIHSKNSMYFDLNKIQEYDVFLAWNPDLPKTKIWNTEDLIVELRYYNIAEDKFAISANGVLVYDSPIPHLHKELPFVKYDNHIYRNRLVQMWNYQLLEDAEDYLDKIRQQTIDITKANIWFNVIEKDSDFDPEVHKIWVNEFIELDNPDWIKHFSNNIPVNNLVQLKIDWQEDIIWISWVDYRNQIVQWWETATKTTSKNQAQQKQTNLILKRNSFKFYNRFAKLRLADMKLIQSFWNTTIPLKGIHIEWKDFIKLQDWYGLFTITPKMLDWEFNIILQTESLLWDSTEKEKENYLNFFQIFWNLAWDDWKRIINPNKMVEIAWQKIWVDIDVLLEKEIANKSWEEMIWDVIKSMNWMWAVWNDINNPNFIPPENRANNAGWVNVIGWWNTANM